MFCKRLFFSLATVMLSAGAMAFGGPLSLEGRLTLERYPETTPDDPISALNIVQELSPQAAGQVADERLLELRPPDRPNSVTDVRGVNFADLKNEVMALAYRSDRGVGLGLASTGGVALTGGYATEGGMRINLYYVRAISDLNETASRATGLDLTNLPSSSVGITVGWKF